VACGTITLMLMPRYVLLTPSYLSHYFFPCLLLPPGAI
jgi:hypothetical protein